MPAKPLCLALCDRYRQETEAVLASPEFADITATFTPASCASCSYSSSGNTIHCPHHLVEHVGKGRNGNARGSRLAKNCCFDWFIGHDLVRNYMKQGARLLTPGWLRNWPQLLEQQELNSEMDRLFHNRPGSRLVLLDTGIDKNVGKKLCAFADHVDQPWEVLPIGLEGYKSYLRCLILKLRQQGQGGEKRNTAKVTRQMHSHRADYELICDLTGRLAALNKDAWIVDHILDIAGLLFAPQRTALFPVRFSPVRSQQKTTGMPTSDQLSSPQHREQCLSVAEHVREICALALGNARQAVGMGSKRDYEKHLKRIKAAHGKAEKASHQLNNILQVIASHAEFAAMDASEFPFLRKEFELIQMAAIEATEIGKAMGLYTAQPPQASTLSDVNAIAKNVAQAKHMGRRSPVTITIESENAPMLISVEHKWLTELIGQLLSNAMDAIGTKTGKITLRTGFRQVSRAEAEASIFYEKQAPGAYAFLSVTDTGSGMDEPTKKRMFESFFTTRFKRRGLGLSLVLGVTRGTAGLIEVQSFPCKGTTVTCLFPAIPAHAANG